MSDTGPEGYRHGTRRYRRLSVSLFVAGVATFALLYSTQALLPLLSAHFAVSPAESTLTVSVATLALGVSLLVAGPVSEVVGRTPLMHASLVASAAVGLACGAVDSWPLLLALRALQGVTLAGLPAVAMAYLTEEVHPDDAARAAGLYIGGTALGGMSGRLLTGALADLGGWRVALAGLGVLALGCALAVRALLPPSRRFTPAPASLGHLWWTARGLAADPALWCLYGIAGSAMGAFVGVFNAVGFRLAGPPYGLRVGVAGLVFLTYALGSVSSTVAGRVAAQRGQRAVVPVAAAVMLAGVLLTLAAPLPVVVGGLAVVAVGFFAVHGVSSGWVAARARRTVGAAGAASSGYLVAYYAGSSVFGSLAGGAWVVAAWPAVVALCGGLVATTLLLAVLLRRIPSRSSGSDDNPGIVGY